MVICLELGADLHMAQLMPLPLTVSCFSKIQIGFTILVPAHPGSPGQRAFERVCVCVCVCVFDGQSMRARVRACVQGQQTASAAAVIRSSTHRPAHTARAACWDDAGHRRFPASTAPPTTGKHRRRRRRRLPRPKFGPPTRDRFRTIRSRFGSFGPGLSVWATELVSVFQGC